MRQAVVWVALGFLVGGAAVYGVFVPRPSASVRSPIGANTDRPLDAYTIDALTIRQGKPSRIVLDEAVATESAFTAYTFHFVSDGKKVTGLAHIPLSAGLRKAPVIVQFRGYVPREHYQSGVGTRRSAEVFARNGYISLAPDFLGYGGSDNPSSDVFEERFQTYTVALDLLASVGSLPQADSSHIGLWGHSNGGQIALTVLEITRGKYPTTLWAPVTKSFPYSILYYTDEAEDQGKALRKKLADFEKMYDADLYSLVRYTDRVLAPLQLHQGTSDDAVPLRWSDEFVQTLRAKGKEIEYVTYAGADHNLQPSWSTVITRDLRFFEKHFKER